MNAHVHDFVPSLNGQFCGADRRHPEATDGPGFQSGV